MKNFWSKEVILEDAPVDIAGWLDRRIGERAAKWTPVDSYDAAADFFCETLNEYAPRLWNLLLNNEIIYGKKIESLRPFLYENLGQGLDGDEIDTHTMLDLYTINFVAKKLYKNTEDAMFEEVWFDIIDGYNDSDKYLSGQMKW